jgi:hypothetical protein
MDIALKYFEEVYTTEHWMVRIYRVLDKRAPPSPGAPAPPTAMHAPSSQRLCSFMLQDAETRCHALQPGVPQPAYMQWLTQGVLWCQSAGLEVPE